MVSTIMRILIRHDVSCDARNTCTNNEYKNILRKIVYLVSVVILVIVHMGDNRVSFFSLPSNIERYVCKSGGVIKNNNSLGAPQIWRVASKRCKSQFTYICISYDLKRQFVSVLASTTFLTYLFLFAFINAM